MDYRGSEARIASAGCLSQHDDDEIGRRLAFGGGDRGDLTSGPDDLHEHESGVERRHDALRPDNRRAVSLKHSSRNRSADTRSVFVSTMRSAWAS